MFGLIRAWKRRRYAARPFPAEWMPIVEEKLPFISRMDGEERERFLTHLKVFAWSMTFIGAKEVEVTEEMIVMISGSAARIVRNLPLSAYDHLTEVIVYPDHYKHKDSEGIVFGEAHDWGTVVLSWEAVKHGLANPSDGHDTAMHEFAHVLDNQDGTFDGTPELEEHRDYADWAKVLTDHFLKLRDKPHKSVLRRYGATNEAEFFAVATEAFFEKPIQLKRKAPDLYEELSNYYQLDPAEAVQKEKATKPKKKRRKKRRKR